MPGIVTTALALPAACGCQSRRRAAGPAAAQGRWLVPSCPGSSHLMPHACTPCIHFFAHTLLAALEDLLGLPERVEEQLRAAPARCLAFNPWGTLLAVGCLGGAVAIYDYQTRGLAQVLQRAPDPDYEQMRGQGCMGHPQGACDITALLWSADGGTLLSGASDGSLVSWEVVKGEPRLRWRSGCNDGTTSGGITHLAWACSRQQQLRGGSCEDVLVSMSAGPALLLNQYSKDPLELPVIAIGGWVPVQGSSSRGHL